MFCRLVDQGELEPEQSLADYASTPCARQGQTSTGTLPTVLHTEPAPMS